MRKSIIHSLAIRRNNANEISKRSEIAKSFVVSRGCDNESRTTSISIFAPRFPALISDNNNKFRARFPRNGRSRDTVDGGVDSRAWGEGGRLREEVDYERGGSVTDKRRADSPRGSGWRCHSRGHDNRPGATVRSPQSDPRQSWNTEVSSWILLAK